MPQGGPKKIDRPSSTTCSWTLGSGTIPFATNSDPFATFSPRYLFWLTMTGMLSTYANNTRDRKRSSVSKLHDGLHFLLARDSGLALVCRQEEGHLFAVLLAEF